jgi:2-phosphoglycolate phosphatase
MGKIQLVIFDFDGTLVDTAPDLVRATNFYLEAQGLEPLPETRIRAEIGMGLRKLIRDCMPQEGMDDDRARRIEGEFLATYDREYLHSPKLFDGAREFLTEWEGQIAIVSNKRIRYIHPILEKLDVLRLPWTSIIGGDTYPNMKPHPEPFLGAMASCGALPDETLVVGDGTPDVIGSLAVGSLCVAVDYGYQNPEDLMALGAWKRIESLHDLLPLVRSIT